MKITDNAQDRNLGNLFLQEARAANFWGNQSLAEIYITQSRKQTVQAGIWSEN